MNQLYENYTQLVITGLRDAVEIEGQTLYLRTAESDLFLVAVEVLSVKQAYGNYRITVQPVDGDGQIVVEAHRLFRGVNVGATKVGAA